MKWFKHDTDMHTDLKVQALMTKFGGEGYAVWCICLEVLGKEGHKGVLKSESGWKNGVAKVFGWSDNGKLDVILSYLAELGLINSKSFNYGNLYVPKFIKRSDNYTSKLLRTEYAQSTDNVALEQNRTDKIRKEQITPVVEHFVKTKGYNRDSLQKDDWRRLHVAAVRLLHKAVDPKVAVEAIDWVAGGGYEWSLETVSKRYPEFVKNRFRKHGDPEVAELVRKVREQLK